MKSTTSKTSISNWKSKSRSWVWLWCSKHAKVNKKYDEAKNEVQEKDQDVKRLKEKIAEFEVRIGQLNVEKAKADQTKEERDVQTLSLRSELVTRDRWIAEL